MCFHFDVSRIFELNNNFDKSIIQEGDLAIPETGIQLSTLLEFANKCLGIETGKEIYLECGDKLTQEMINCGQLSQNCNLFIHDNIYFNNNKEINHTIKIAIVGPGSVGKSAITQRIIDNTFVPDYDPTIEDLFEKILNIDGCKCNISILDTAGQEDFAGLREVQMKDKNGYIMCYSLINFRTFDDLQSFYETLMDVLDAEECDMKPMILCGNKCDLPTDQYVVTENVRNERERIWKASKQYLTSALNGHNIRNMIAWLVRDIINDLYPVSTLKNNNKKFDDDIVVDPDAFCCSECLIM